MATLTNLGIVPVTLPTLHIVPRLGVLELTNELITGPDNWPVIGGLSLSGQIAVELDPVEEPEPEPAPVEEPPPEEPAGEGTPV